MNMRKYFPVLQYINVPNLITTLGMTLGVVACYFLNRSQLKAVIICLFFASAMDLLDGFFAGKLNQGTRFGQYADSLNDFFICCVLPVLCAFRFTEADALCVAAASFYCACGLWRLAHFDVLLAENRDYFTGMPVPSGMGFTILALYLTVKLGLPVWGCALVYLAAGLMMICCIQLKKYGLWQKVLALGGLVFIIIVAILP